MFSKIGKFSSEKLLKNVEYWWGNGNSMVLTRNKNFPLICFQRLFSHDVFFCSFCEMLKSYNLKLGICLIFLKYFRGFTVNLELQLNFGNQDMF